MIVPTNADGSGAARRRVSASPVRVVVEGVWPELDAGRFPIKRVVGEDVWIEADVFADGHDMVAAALRFRSSSDRDWREVRMTDAGNDRWRGCFDVSGIAEHAYTVVGWIDRFETWRRDLRKKVDAGVDVAVDLLAGAELIKAAARRADGDDRERLRAAAKTLGGKADTEALRVAFDEGVRELAAAYPDRRTQGAFERELRVNVDRPRARFSSWYELFPRSASPEPGRHGTFDDVIARLAYVQELGFDVLYLPPIHPIAHERRKGKNNAATSKPGDPGSPWAIGAVEGGHTAVHPDLGTLEDFARLIAAAAERDIEVALDIAFQCTPEHPWVREHPEWFEHRPDGSIQHAENPPKVYQDIYPLDFETKDAKDRRALWEALRDVFLFWCERGVRMFRVDNPHTKPFPFWEWAIAEVHAEYPDAIFLAEAFTRPKVMYRLAKLGFTQSYTYFTWKNTKQDLTDYLTELTRTGAVEFFRPNFWPNTPDILHEYLQTGGRPAFAVRLVLAATLASNYGIYGPAFELMEHAPIQPGSEEYLNSEKYEIRHWDLERADSLAPLVAKVNRIRRENAALQDMRSLRFHGIGNDQMIAYSKRTEDRANVIVVVANLDSRHARSGWTDLALDELGFGAAEAFEVEDLLTGAVYTWRGPSNFVQLDPVAGEPAHVFRVGPRRSGAAAAATRARQAVPA